MMIDLPHYTFPLALTTTGSMAVVQQDSDEEIAASIATLIAYPQGSRSERPDFGVPEDLFEQGAPNLALLREAVETQETRASDSPELSAALLEQGVALVRFGFSPIDESP